MKKKGDKGKFELVSKGFGYLSFDKPESAKNAIEDLNGKYLPGFESWNRTLIIELFMTKNERKFAENQHLNSTNYFINPNNPPYNYVGGFPYPYSYPLPGPMPPMSFNQYTNYGNNYNYGFKKNWRGGNKNNYRNNFRNNNYRGNKKNNNNNRQQKNDLNEENKEINKNKIDLTEYNKLEDEGEKLDFLGEKIFKAIEDSQIASERKIDINTISRITGMIIGLPDKNEIIEILENPNILNSRIEEALKLLEGKE